MKPSTSALIGAVILSGGCISLPAVAFAAEVRAPAGASAVAKNASLVAAHASGDTVGTCSADAHAHASSCTCARCAAAQGE